MLGVARQQVARTCRCGGGWIRGHCVAYSPQASPPKILGGLWCAAVPFRGKYVEYSAEALAKKLGTSRQAVAQAAKRKNGTAEGCRVWVEPWPLP